MSGKKDRYAHRRQALMYLRDGSPFGGVPVLTLIQDSIYALDEKMPHTPNGLRGLGVARSNIPQAIKLLSEALAEVSLELGHQNGSERTKRRKAK